MPLPLLLALGLLVCHGVAPPPAAGSPEGGRLLGRVVEPGTRAGIGAVRVRLEETGAAVLSGTDGRFEFDQLAPGRYTIVAALEGFVPSDAVVVTLADGDERRIEIEYTLRISSDVTARRPDNVEPAPIAGAVRTALDSRAIALSPGGLEDVYRVLQTRPGVAASMDDRNDLLVRGGGAIETATRIDGFDIPNPSHFGAQGGSGGGLGALSPWVIEQATLEPGGFSVQFGERASSIVDIRIRDGNRTRFTGAAGAGVGGVMALAEGPLAGGRGSWLVSPRRSFLELVFERGTAEAVPKYADAVSKVDLLLSERHHLDLLAFGARDDIDARSSRDSHQVLRDRQLVAMAGVSLASQWTRATSTTLVASFDTMEVDATLYNSKGQVDGADHGIERELRLRAELRRRAGERAEIVAGAGVTRALLSYDLTDEAFRNGYNNLVSPVRAHRQDRAHSENAFGELTAAPVSWLRATAGARVDDPATGDGLFVSPRASAEVRLARALRATASWGVYRQAIPYIWIGSDPRNARLDPITSRQATAGLELEPREGLRLTVEGFDKRYENYPVDPAVPSRVLVSAAADFESPFVGQLWGGGRVRARGVDAGLSERLWRRLEASAAYSYWRVTAAGLDRVWRPGDYDIRHQGRLEAAWRGGRRWSVGASWRLATGRPYTPYDTAASIKAGSGRYDVTRINARRYPAYHRLDARADWTLLVGRAVFVLFAEIDNAYDRRNVYFYDWDSKARTADPSYQWGRMPVAGVRVEF
jgi:hypothetical protein